MAIPWLALWLAVAPGMAQEAAPPLAEADDFRVHLTGHEPSIGLEGARYTIVQFSDWRCPHCARAWDTLDAAVRERPDVRLVFKVYPLTTECNPGVSSSNGVDRCVLAAGAACADAQSRFHDYARWAFDNQSMLSGVDRYALAAQIHTVGIEPAEFARCMDSAVPAGAVQADAEEGTRLGIRGTPTLYLFDRDTGRWEQISGGAAGVVERIGG